MPASAHDAPRTRSVRLRRRSGRAPAGMLAAVAGLAALAALALAGRPLAAQAGGEVVSERVGYANPADGMRLNAQLARPGGAGPHPAVVLLSVAGTDPVVARLVQDGFVVLMPELRGFARVEPLLQASFDDLAGDVAAAMSYLAGRPEVDAGALALVAQSDNAPQAILHAGRTGGVPLVLLAPPAFPGPETFRLEQRGVAQNQGWTPVELDALDSYVRELSQIMLEGRTPQERAFRLEAARARSRIQLPRNAAFPNDAQQTHFFSSPLWHDRIGFDPEAAMAALQGPVLVLIGADDPNTPMEAYLAAMRRGVASSRTRDGVVCRLPGRTRHTFSEQGVGAIAEWLGARVDASPAADTRTVPPGTPPAGCLGDDEHP